MTGVLTFWHPHDLLVHYTTREVPPVIFVPWAAWTLWPWQVRLRPISNQPKSSSSWAIDRRPISAQVRGPFFLPDALCCWKRFGFRPPPAKQRWSVRYGQDINVLV